MDGGKGHVSAALMAVRAMGYDVPIVGMVKDDSHRTRALVYELDGRQKRAEDCFFLEDGHWNCWLSGAVSPEHIKVNLLTGNMAEATFQLTHGEEWISMRVALDFEDGAWRIDDWLQIGDTGQSMLQDMEDYLNRNK